MVKLGFSLKLTVIELQLFCEYILSFFLIIVKFMQVLNSIKKQKVEIPVKRKVSFRHFSNKAMKNKRWDRGIGIQGVVKFQLCNVIILHEKLHVPQ